MPDEHLKKLFVSLIPDHLVWTPDFRLKSTEKPHERLPQEAPVLSKPGSHRPPDLCYPHRQSRYAWYVTCTVRELPPNQQLDLNTQDEECPERGGQK